MAFIFTTLCERFEINYVLWVAAGLSYDTWWQQGQTSVTLSYQYLSLKTVYKVEISDYSDLRLFKAENIIYIH